MKKYNLTGPKYKQSCEQINRFEEKVHLNFTPNEIVRICDAIELMIELHIDQAPRHDGTHYIDHPLFVGIGVLDAMEVKDPDIVIATLLHDTVEDQSAKLALKVNKKEGKSQKDLALHALECSTQSSRVKNIVLGLTNPNFESILKEKGIQKEIDSSVYYQAKNQLYAEHVRAAIVNSDVALIKTFDFAANTLYLDAVKDLAQKNKYLKKYTPVIQIILDRLQDNRNKMNITAEKREQMVSNFINAQSKMSHLK